MRFNFNKWKIITAGPKDKIVRYKITNPYIQSFIWKYENLIPWNEIKDQQSISAYIASELLPDLRSKIDLNSDDNHYLKDINLEREFAQNIADPQIRAAYEIYQSDPEKAKQTILNQVNKEKYDSFMAWWKYVNTTYKDNPAFVYCMLKPVINSSTANDKAGPTTVNAEAVAHTNERVRENPNLNYLKDYKDIAAKLDAQGANIDTTAGGWIMIPSKVHDEKNFPQNVEKLKRWSSGNGWCTAAGMAEPYLSKGDFWLFIKNGRAVVAIRLSGNNVAEVRGINNSVPALYSDEVIGLFNQHPEWSKNKIEELLEIKSLNAEAKSNPRVLDEAFSKSNPIKVWDSLYMENRTPENAQLLKKALLSDKRHDKFTNFGGEVDPNDRALIELFVNDKEIGEACGNAYDQIVPSVMLKNPYFVVSRKKVILKNIDSGKYVNFDDPALSEFISGDPEFMDNIYFHLEKNPLLALDRGGKVQKWIAANREFAQQLINIIKRDGESLLKKSPRDLDKVQDICKFSPEKLAHIIVDNPMIGFDYMCNGYYTDSPGYYASLPAGEACQFIKTNPELYSRWKQNVIKIADELLDSDMWIMRSVITPEMIQSNPKILDTYIKKLKEKANPQLIPNFIWEIPGFAERVATEVLPIYNKSSPAKIEGIMKYLPPHLHEIDEKKISRYLKKYPGYYRKVPEHKRTQEMFENAVNGFIQIVKEYPKRVLELYNSLDNTLKNDERVKNAAAEAFGWRVLAYASTYKSTPSDIVANPAFVNSMVRNCKQLMNNWPKWPAPIRNILMQNGIKPPIKKAPQRNPVAVPPVQQQPQNPPLNPPVVAKSWWNRIKNSQNQKMQQDELNGLRIRLNSLTLQQKQLKQQLDSLSNATDTQQKLMISQELANVVQMIQNTNQQITDISSGPQENMMNLQSLPIR